jgi:hypothetical protein
MKKLLLCAVFISALTAAGGQLLAQEKLGAFFWVEDAIGNRDTVWLYIKDGATDEFDPELEVNLYGIPPQGDLDLRIIQRTDTNGFYLDTEEPVWLNGYFDDPYLPGVDAVNYGWLKPYSCNADLKTNYVENRSGLYPIRQFAIFCYAKHYPIYIYLFHPCRGYCNPFVDGYHHLNPIVRATAHYVEHGRPFGAFGGSFPAEDDDTPYVIDSSYMGDVINKLVLLYEFHPMSSIEDNVEIRALYPNPSNQYVILDDVSIGIHNLIDANGSIVKEFDIDAIPYQFDISKLLDGNYFITNNSKKYLFKLVKVGGTK